MQSSFSAYNDQPPSTTSNYTSSSSSKKPQPHSLPDNPMRQSVVPNRISQAASLSSHSNNAAALSRLQEKKKEFEAVTALERASSLFLKRIEGLADDCEVMADAGQG